MSSILFDGFPMNLSKNFDNPRISLPRYNYLKIKERIDTISSGRSKGEELPIQIHIQADKDFPEGQYYTFTVKVKADGQVNFFCDNTDVYCCGLLFADTTDKRRISKALTAQYNNSLKSEPDTAEYDIQPITNTTPSHSFHKTDANLNEHTPLLTDDKQKK